MKPTEQTETEHAHTVFLRQWKDQREVRDNARAKRKQAFLASSKETQSKWTDTAKSSKEGFEYPALDGESKEVKASFAYCNAIKKAEAQAGINLIQLLTNAFAEGVLEGARTAQGEGARAPEPAAPAEPAQPEPLAVVTPEATQESEVGEAPPKRKAFPLTAEGKLAYESAVADFKARKAA